ILNFQQWTPSVNGWTGLFGSLSGMRPPAGTIIFVEEIQNGYGGAFDNVNGRGGGGFLNTWEDLVGVFHKNGDNYGFADGHVEFHAYENLANMIRIRNLILYPQPGQNRFPSAVNDPDFAWLVHHLNPIYFP
ncbi:MAG: hypothetical protein NTV49_04605, partial [Kiritimatiellaeota bacterium]|nr:hypothetical protein [Kiritimatiellota bacterium]